MQFYLLFFALMLFACGPVDDSPADSSSSVDNSSSSVEPSSSSNFSEEELEMLYNYELLKAFFYHPERIQAYSAYKGMEVDDMYASLEDYLKGNRYTKYYTPDIAEIVLRYYTYSETYYSFGFERYLSEDRDTLIVYAVYPISPANSAGLKKYDKLISANGTPLTGENAALYVETDSSFAQSTVFTVLRNGELITLPAMQKEEVISPTVYLDSLKGVPLITVTEFTANTNNPDGTYQEFKDVLQEIKGTKAAIIDLRGNPGGSIYHCTAMAAELSPLNIEMLYDIEHYQNRNRINVIDTTHYFPSDYIDETGEGLEIKWIILMDGGSASCAERFTAALQSTRPETVIIGETSYGKGIGQTLNITYLDGLAVVTCLQSYYPNNETFHEVGIVPSIRVNPKSDEIYTVAQEAARGFGAVLAKQNIGEFNAKTLPPKHSSKKTDLGAYNVKY